MYEHELHHTIWIECGVSHMQEKNPHPERVCNQTHVWVNDQKCTYINTHKACTSQGLHLYIPWNTVQSYKCTQKHLSILAAPPHRVTPSCTRWLTAMAHVLQSRNCASSGLKAKAGGAHMKAKTHVLPKAANISLTESIWDPLEISHFFFCCPSWKTKQTSLQTFWFLIEICTCFVCWEVEVMLTYY